MGAHNNHPDEAPSSSPLLSTIGDKHGGELSETVAEIAQHHAAVFRVRASVKLLIDPISRDQDCTSQKDSAHTNSVRH
jgi:hypothetical protein